MKAFKKNICVEEFISRIPGLFPYIEFNEFGEIVKHKATDSVDGCYGKMIPDVILDGETMPYRTLMRRYYDGDETVADFVNKAIGKFLVSDFDINVSGQLVPIYIYAAEAKSLLTEMIRLREACKVYEHGQSITSSSLCCDCDEYKKRGGDNMIELLKYLIGYADEIAEEYLDYTTSDASYAFFINLSGSYEDLGYFTPYTDSKVFEKYGDKYEKVTKQSSISIGVDNVVSTDSKLKSLRCFTTYINSREKYEEPETGNDWLYFYQKGYVANYETVNDDLGNIMTIDDAPKVMDSEGYVTNLLAYGGLITDIECDQTENTITFTYYINAHLKAKLVSDANSDVDEYEFPFVYESGGVKQTETYFYAEGGELDSLLNDGDNPNAFNDYIIGKTPRKFEERKCEFSVMGSTLSYNKRIWDKEVEIPYQQSRLEYLRNCSVVTYNADIFKEDYLIGVHFQPAVDSKVNIRRGNNAAFERHIRLGEVKTLEDMENYMNGSFFNIQQIV